MPHLSATPIDDSITTENTFEALLSPLIEVLEAQSAPVDEKARSKKLFFADFVRILIYSFAMGIESLRKLVTELETSSQAKDLDIEAVPFSTLKEGFSRFPASAFQTLFISVLTGASLLTIPEIRNLGNLYLIDSSMFPAIITMYWAEYKKTKNAIRLHLAFELNRMIPVEFAIGSGNSNERNFLISIIKSGITYVADRGYFAFNLFKEITAGGAFFIIRVKDNLCYTIVEILPTCGVPQGSFDYVCDYIVTLDNDDSNNQYRLTIFSLFGLPYFIVSNRFDLNTFEIIIIYAYRWQVELIFRFLKHTMKGLHLFNHSKNGVQICFYVLLITSLLQLRIKQICIEKTEKSQIQNPSDSESPEDTQSLANVPVTYNSYSFMGTVGEKLKKYWKIGCHWLIKLRNLITQPFNSDTIQKLGTGHG